MRTLSTTLLLLAVSSLASASENAKAPLAGCTDVRPTRFPELTCSLLSDNAVQGKEKGLVFMSFANDNYLALAINWAKNVRAAVGAQKMLLGAMTETVYTKLQEENIPTFRMNSAVEKGDLGWGGKDFREMGRDKVRLVVQVLKMRWPAFVLTDSDVQWVANPASFFARYPKADALVSVDGAGSDRLKEVEGKLVATSTDIGRRTALITTQPLPALNIGICFFRSSPASRALSKKWLKSIEETDVWDQQALDDMLRMSKDELGHRPYIGSNDLLYTPADGHNVSWGLLPNAQFAGGEDYFASRLPEKLGVPLYGIHADFTNWGFNGKRAKLRAAGLWHDDNDYFEGKFLALDLVIPENLLEPYTDINVVFDAPERHVKLVNYQLRQVAYAAAIAKGLGRVLVLPQILCTCEYYWAPIHDRKCRFPTVGNNQIGTTMPYVCPPDQIWNMMALDEKLPHRQAGFLNNSRLPYIDQEEFVLVGTPRQGHSSGKVFEAETMVSKAPYVEIASQSPLTMSALRLALEPHAKVPVMVLKAGQAEMLLGGFDNAEERGQFQQSTQDSTSQWCCSDASLVQGGVKYQGLGDAEPGWPAFDASRKPELRCMPVHVAKNTNAKGLERLEGSAGDWWGTHYPHVAAQMCAEHGLLGNCRNSTKGLCRCPVDATPEECFDSADLALVQEGDAKKSESDDDSSIDDDILKQLGLSAPALAERFATWPQPVKQHQKSLDIVAGGSQMPGTFMRREGETSAQTAAMRREVQPHVVQVGSSSQMQGL